MHGRSLTGHVEPAGHNRWRLVVNLPSETTVDVTGRSRTRYPKHQRTVQTTGKRAAQKLLNAWIAELESHACVDVDRFTVKAMLELWLHAIRNDVRPVTLQWYTDNARRHLVPALGDRVAAQVQRAELLDFYAAAQERGLSEAFTKHLHSTIRAAYSWAVSEEILDRNPAARVKRPPRAVHKERVTFTDQELAYAIVGARGLSVQVPAVLGGWGGLRPSETCAMRWDCVDFERSAVYVVRSVEELHDGTLVPSRPKSKESERPVLMPRQAMEILAWWHEQYLTARKVNGPGWNPEGFVVWRRDGRQMRPSSLASLWRDYCRRRKLPPVSLHGLRHTHISAVVERSGLKVAQERAGHSKLTTTANIYTHLRDRAVFDDREQAEDGIAASIAAVENSRPIRGQLVELPDRLTENPSK